MVHKLLISSFVALFLMATLVYVSPVVGAEMTLESGVAAAEGTGVPQTLVGNGGLVSQIINILLFAIGIISVIMIIIGGLRYVISGGNSTAVTAAKNTILYAIVGLVVAIFAFAIINWVLDSILGGGVSGFSGGSVGGNSVAPTNR